MLNTWGLRKGQEQYEEYIFGGRPRVQYAYRHTDDQLFTCVARSLRLARAKRNVWLKYEYQERPE